MKGSHEVDFQMTQGANCPNRSFFRIPGSYLIGLSQLPDPGGLELEFGSPSLSSRYVGGNLDFEHGNRTQ